MFVEPDGATSLDPDEKNGLKHGHITTRGELNALEQTNIEEALRWLPRKRKGDILDAAFVRELHKRLFGEVWSWAGNYRKREKNIGIAPYQISMQLQMLLDDARYWAENGIYTPLEAAARFHHRMVQIHLFPNGNGRHARIAADIYLNDYYDHAEIIWADGTDLSVAGRQRGEYISALRQADAGNYDALLRFVGMNAQGNG